MAQIECPYCRHVYELNTDDGHGGDTDIPHEEQCVSCNKWFTFRTEVTYSHYCSTADCLNGSKHLLEFESSDFTGESLVFRCKNCDSRFSTANNHVLKNMFFNDTPCSDFKFNDFLFNQFGLVISQAILNYKRALKSYIYFFGRREQQYQDYVHFFGMSEQRYQDFRESYISHQLKDLLEATEAKQTIMRAFAKLFPDECADIYRC